MKYREIHVNYILHWSLAVMAYVAVSLAIDMTPEVATSIAKFNNKVFGVSTAFHLLLLANFAYILGISKDDGDKTFMNNVGELCEDAKAHAAFLPILNLIVSTLFAVSPLRDLVLWGFSLTPMALIINVQTVILGMYLAVQFCVKYKHIKKLKNQPSKIS